jgi:hypothetical protein
LTIGDFAVRNFGCPTRVQKLTLEMPVCSGAGSEIGFDLDSSRFAVVTLSGVSTDAGWPRSPLATPMFGDIELIRIDELWPSDAQA